MVSEDKDNLVELKRTLKRTQEELRQVHEELEERVKARTIELSQSNDRMREQIVSRRRIEEALYNEKEFLTAVLNNMKDGIVACDSNGILTVFNRASREFHGFSESPIPPEQWAQHYDLYRPDGKIPLEKEDIPLYRALQGEKVHNLEMVIAPKNAPLIRVSVDAQAIFDSQGKKIGAIASMHNVTERRRAEEELRKQQILLQYIINFVPHAIFWKDREDRFLGGNINFLNKALGVNTIDEFIGKNDYDFFPKEQADYFRKCDFAVMESGEPMIDIEEPQRQEGSGERILLTSKVPLRNEEGSIIGLLGSFVDITERKRMEEELEKAKKAAEAAAQAKSEFLTTISHEIRTPLTLILGPLEMILSTMQPELSPRLRVELERIRRNGSRLYALVNDILDFSKIEAGKTQVHWELVDPACLVREIVTDVSSTAEKRGLKLQFKCDSDLGQIPLDWGKFEKIILNLLGNALKFTPQGGWIQVELRSIKESIELSVSDSGPGIAPEKQRLLFQRFQQLDSSTTRKHEGTGIGLALVKEFTHLMGGQVGLESEPGKGSRFFVRFSKSADPIMKSRADLLRSSGGHSAADHRTELMFKEISLTPTDVFKKENEKEKEKEEGKAEKPLVLIVEDNADMREYISEILTNDYSIDKAENGLQALSAIQVKRPDIIVSDIMMPEMDGLELVAHIKGSSELQHIPIILLTAKASYSEIVRGLKTGANDYLGKPFAPEELKARVQSAFRLYRTLLDLEATLKNLRQTQESLVQSEKMAAVGTLIAGISHELNNPLGAILMNVQFLLKSLSLQEESFIKNGLTTIESQTQRCAHLVRALLDISRKKPLKKEVIHLTTLFNTVETLAEPLAQQKRVLLSFDKSTLSQSHMTLRVCIQELETALLNVIRNGIFATPAGGHVWVKIRECRMGGHDKIEISISDTGEGIANTVLPRVFDPFFTTKSPDQGTGIGLSLTKKIIESHGGTIHLESTLGKGTIVKFLLPLESQNS